jgi:hypothetical protein
MEATDVAWQNELERVPVSVGSHLSSDVITVVTMNRLDSILY